MSKHNLILIGAGGHAHACIEVIEQCDQFNIVGLVGMPEEMDTQHLGYSVIATDDDLQKLANEYQYAIVSVGQIQSPEARIRLYHRAVELGFKMPTIVAPSALVSHHATIGAGTIVMSGALINAGASVGVNCIINTHSLIEHDTSVGNYCHISTGAILNGNVKIGIGCFVGSGTVIKEGVSIGDESIVGMGLTVRHNLIERTRFVGNDKT